MSEKQRFQEILEEIRNDIKFLKVDLSHQLYQHVEREVKLQRILDSYGLFAIPFRLSGEVKKWILDVFLDKWYEIEAKILMIIRDLGFSKPKLNFGLVKKYAEELACGSFTYSTYVYSKTNDLFTSISRYESDFESVMGAIRQNLYLTEWTNVEKLKIEDYVNPIQRAKYVLARDELDKAKKAVKDNQWDEVLNHLGPAIDFAIREKYGFGKIHPMKQFLRDAEKYSLPLPSYTMLYDYFDEGSKRIHEGKLNTPYECQKALEFVAGFIDRLELINVTQEQIDDFKSKSKAVE